MAQMEKVETLISFTKMEVSLPISLLCFHLAAGKEPTAELESMGVSREKLGQSGTNLMVAAEIVTSWVIVVVTMSLTSQAAVHPSRETCVIVRSNSYPLPSLRPE